MDCYTKKRATDMDHMQRLLLDDYPDMADGVLSTEEADALAGIVEALEGTSDRVRLIVLDILDN